MTDGPTFLVVRGAVRIAGHVAFHPTDDPDHLRKIIECYHRLPFRRRRPDDAGACEDQAAPEVLNQGD